MAGAGLYVFVAVIGMAKQWAKIYRNVKDSDRLTAVAPRAGAWIETRASTAAR